MLWSSPDNRVLIHFADSPCHGKYFHDMPEHDALYNESGLETEMKVTLKVSTYRSRVTNVVASRVEPPTFFG